MTLDLEPIKNMLNDPEEGDRSSQHLALRNSVDEIERLRAIVSELADAGNDLCLRLITVKPTLEKPYPDDARWSPWTRFIEDRWRRLGKAVTASWVLVPKRRLSSHVRQGRDDG